MRRSLIAASAALMLLLSLCACGDTGSRDDHTVSPSNSAGAGDVSPSQPDNNNNNSSGLPNNAGGTANSGTGDLEPGENGTGNLEPGESGTGEMARSGHYRAGSNGAVGGGGESARDMLRDAGDAVRDAARDVGRAVTGGK